ncbi:MAG TPA: hypothetical protein DCS93_15075 [Microscillaceae bacterium]|nr:hypothetical protein [Microscillaceae bacterium]
MQKTFKYSQRTKILKTIFASISFFVASGITASIFLERNFTPPIHTWYIIIIMGVILPLWLVLATFTFKIEITTTSIIATTLFKRREIRLEQIKGFKYTRWGYVMVLVHNDNPALDMGFEQEVLKLDGLKEWIIEHFNDITPKDDLDEVLQNPQFGIDKEERLRKFKNSTRRHLIVNLVTIVYLISFFAYILYYKALPAFFLIPTLLFPWITLYIIYREDGMARLLTDPEKVKNSYPGYMFALITQTTLIGFYGVRYEPINYQDTVYLMILFGSIFAIATLYALHKSALPKKKTDRIGRYFIALICALIYGFASTLAMNGAFDQAKVAKVNAIIIKKYRDGDEHKVQIQIERGQVTSENISKDIYQVLKKGDQIIVHQKQGFLGIPWILKIENKKNPSPKR